MDLKDRGDTYNSMSTVLLFCKKFRFLIERKALLFTVFFSFLIFIVNGCVVSSDRISVLKSKTILLKTHTKKCIRSFAVSLNFPLKKRDSYPVIISQHGSDRDGMFFKGGLGRTDEFTTRLIKKGTQMGFAVVAIDAFFSTNLEPSDKGKFPNAIKYAIQLKEFLSKQKKFQKKIFFILDLVMELDRFSNHSMHAQIIKDNFGEQLLL